MPHLYLRIALLVCLSAARLGWAQQQPAPPVRRIIDVHLHARAAADYGPTPPPNPVSGRVPAYRTDAEVVAVTLAELKRHHVVRAVTSGSQPRVAAYLAADPARIIGALDYPDNQHAPLPDTATFRRLFAEGQFRVFGELGLQYEGKTLTDPALEPYLAICERRGIPVALHTGLGFPGIAYNDCCRNFRTRLGNPQLVEEVLIRHPRLKLQLMHMGYPYLAETKALLYIYPQLYADISVTNWILPRAEFYSYLQALVTAGYGQRLLYGSDQMAWPDAIGLSIESVEKAPFLSEKQKQDIFYNNAATFYGLR
ncbi:amidohydrolase family protein [Hymenobacter chitinivorans]|uniref:Amidohydrolase-related domain-containing protein n=1 Tax=Hymenobacter chitinivorans DSM 11115 TaxID=1121954 RepID=A0A2M9BSS3_9BACT|nr:amidohydrolase family protein [Hymenobacter chitinivorans]PJJ61010.1 hypothetical protein CLV45_2447 [Hymenobacter chitinivorans DSM 11115]